MCIRSSGDVSDAVGASFGAAGVIFTESELGSEFFDLRTGLAGEFFQKFINYRVRVALIIPDPSRYGDRFRELAREHSSHRMIRVVGSRDEAEMWLQAASDSQGW